MADGMRPTLAEADEGWIHTQLARLADRDHYSRQELVGELDRRAARRDRAAAAQRDAWLFRIAVAAAFAAGASAFAAVTLLVQS